MKILIIQRQISPRKLRLKRFSEKNQCSIFSLAPSVCLVVRRGAKGKGGGGIDGVCDCKAPCVGVGVLLCFSRLDLSFVTSSLCCYSVNPLGGGGAGHLQTGSEEMRCNLGGGAILSREK